MPGSSCLLGIFQCVVGGAVWARIRAVAYIWLTGRRDTLWRWYTLRIWMVGYSRFADGCFGCSCED